MNLWVCHDVLVYLDLDSGAGHVEKLLFGYCEHDKQKKRGLDSGAALWNRSGLQLLIGDVMLQDFFSFAGRLCWPVVR